MSEDDAVLWTLAVNFALLSFLAIGGVNTLLPEMHRQAVEVYGWMSSQRFTDLFAIAQGAPGPNLIVVTLVGWEVAGLPGALVTTVALVGPTSILTYFVGDLWDRFRRARWRMALQGGLVPVTIGLVAAGAYVLAQATDRSIMAVVITVGTAVAMYFTRLHPVSYLVVGGAVGLAGYI